MPDSGSRRGRRRVLIAAGAGVPVLVAAIAIVAYLMLRVTGSAQQTARAYLSAWQRADYPAMASASIHVPAGGLAGPVGKVATELGQKSIHITMQKVTASGGTAQAPFTASVGLTSGQTWTYHGKLKLVTRNRKWWVDWSTAAIYPGLRAGEKFALAAVWPARGQIIGADGTVLSSPATIAQSGSLSLLTGNVGPATAAEAKQLGAPYQAGDDIGQGGIEQAYESRLAGRPSLLIKLEGPGSHVDATVAKFAGKAGQTVHASIEMRYQLAAAHAVESASTSKPIDIVALQPSTGHVLAVVERPGGYDRALQGIFPPGSTFKIVTGSALVKAGLRPDTTVQCPPHVDIGGRVFHNFDDETFGTTTLINAFAVSCNTTFAMLATQHLTGGALRSMAQAYGFNAKAALGIPATLGHFTTPHQPVDLAADAFGQGTDLVNPLSEAVVAGAVENGTWLPPVLVTDPAPKQPTAPHKLSAGILAALRPMMRAVVTSGTASHVGFPPGVHGKTGTAEYGSGPNPPSHAWFIGYRGDLAVAVLVEGGGVGADASGPIANAFFRHV